MQILSEAAKHLRRKERNVTMKPHTTTLPKQHEDQKGIRGERGDGSVSILGKRAIRRGERGWVLTIIFHGVEISIDGGVEEIVYPNPKPSRCPYIWLLTTTPT